MRWLLQESEPISFSGPIPFSCMVSPIDYGCSQNHSLWATIDDNFVHNRRL